MLSVKYGADVPLAMAEVLEHHARSTGLSLEAIETLGASLDSVEAFIVAAEEGRGADFARERGLVAPRGDVARARWIARRLFGIESGPSA